MQYSSQCITYNTSQAGSTSFPISQNWHNERFHLRKIYNCPHHPTAYCSRNNQSDEKQIRGWSAVAENSGTERCENPNHCKNEARDHESHGFPSISTAKRGKNFCTKKQIVVRAQCLLPRRKPKAPPEERIKRRARDRGMLTRISEAPIGDRKDHPQMQNLKLRQRDRDALGRIKGRPREEQGGVSLWAWALSGHLFRRRDIFKVIRTTWDAEIGLRR